MEEYNRKLKDEGGSPVVDRIAIDYVDAPPLDRFHLLKVSFVLQAVGMLVPWNAFITITSYWSAKLEGSRFYGNYMNYFTFINCGVFLISSFIFSRVQHRLSLYTRVLVPLFGNIILFTACLVFTFTPGVSGDVFFYITIVIVALAAVCNTYVTAFLPNVYTLVTVQGEAWAGLAVSIVNVVAIVLSASVIDAAKVFFILAVGVLVVCFFSYILIVSSKFVKHWHKYHMSASSRAVYPNSAPATFVGPSTSTAEKFLYDDTQVTWATWFRVFWAVLPLSLAIFYNFVVTLAIFPVVPMMIVPLTDPGTNAVWSRFWGDLWVPIYVFVFFNIGDLLARMIGPFLKIPRWPVLPVALLRTAFLPLFLFCNVKCWDPKTAAFVSSKLPDVFMHDAYPITWMFLLSFTNGYTYQMAMNHAADSVVGKERPVANSICQTLMVFGFAIGTMASFGVKWLNCGGNPFLY